MSAKITYDIQTLEPGALIELLELDATSIGGDILRFHGYTMLDAIVWQGESYSRWPLQIEGLEKNSSQPPRPTITVGNIDGSIGAACLAFQDLLGAKLTRHITFGKYLDAVNFTGGNPTADPTQEITPEVYIVDRKAQETSEAVQFELASPLNLDGVQVPGRQIIANVCPWLSIGGYRGPYCGYTGPAVAKADDTPTSVMAEDKCGGRVSSCKLRFGNDPDGLAYGGFPAAGLIRT